MLWRMALLPAAIIFLSAIAIVGTNRLKQISPANRHDVTLLYVGAEDCAPCRSWRRGAGATFRSSQGFLRISYREVISHGTQPSQRRILARRFARVPWPSGQRNRRAAMVCHFR